MFCSNCGNKNEDGVKFCSKCGTPIGSTNNVDNNVIINNQQVNVTPVENNNFNNLEQQVNIIPMVNNLTSNEKSGKNVLYKILNIVAIIMGVLSIFVCYFADLKTLLYAAVGFIIIFFIRKKYNVKISLLVNIIAVISTVGFYGCRVLFNINLSIPFSGEYECYEIDNGSTKPTRVVKFNSDYSVVFGEYGNLDKNYWDGKYEYKYDKVINSGKTVGVGYKLKIKVDGYYADGERIESLNNKELEDVYVSVQDKKNIVFTYDGWYYYVCHKK